MRRSLPSAEKASGSLQASKLECPTVLVAFAFAFVFAFVIGGNCIWFVNRIELYEGAWSLLLLLLLFSGVLGDIIRPVWVFVQGLIV